MTAPDLDFVSYARTGAEAPFRALVERHADMVHSTAARVLGNQAHLAVDVAQAVFVRLAQRARVLPEGIVIGGWLHCQARRLALNAATSEARRRSREAKAVADQPLVAMIDEPDSATAASVWRDIAPLLDEALARLSTADRDAVMLRFFENKPLRDVGEQLGLSPDAAQKRVARALERLRLHLTRRGVVVPAAMALGSLLAGHAVQASPIGWQASVASTALRAAQSGNASGALGTLMVSYAGSGVLGAAAGLVFALWLSSLTAVRSDGLSKSAPVPTQADVISAAVTSQPTGSLPVALVGYEPRTLPEIVAALAKLGVEPFSHRLQVEAEALLERVAPQNYLECLRLLAIELPEPFHRRTVTWACSLWEKVAPDVLSSALLTSDESARPVPGGFVSNSLHEWCDMAGYIELEDRLASSFGQWVKRDTCAASRWLAEHRSTALLGHRYRFGPWQGRGTAFDALAEKLAGHLATASPEAQTAIAQAATEAGLDLSSLGFAARSFSGDPRARLDSLAAQPSPRSDWLSAAAANLALKNAAACQQWIEARPTNDSSAWHAALGLCSGDSMNQTRHNGRLLDLPSSDSLLGRLDMAYARRGERTVDSSLADIVRASSGWLEEEASAPTCREWLLRQGSAGSADEALAAGARALGSAEGARSSRYAEALRWAAAIQDTEAARPLLRGLMRLWLDHRPDTAREFPKQENWPASHQELVSDLLAAHANAQPTPQAIESDKRAEFAKRMHR